MAPTGSSTFRVRSTYSTLRQTRTPATAPMTNAQNEETNAQGAVMATSPASMPLIIMLMSGLPYLLHMQNIATIAPEAEASIVLTAITEMRRSAPASVLPGLKPNQPNARMKHPSAAMGMLWPGIGLGVPSLLYLPMRAPSTIAPARAVTPPTMCTTEEPAKSTCPWPSPKFLPSCESQPPPHTQLANRGYVIIEMKKP